MNPFAFIVGCARSGTTLLRRIVDAHPAVAITPETHWIADYFERRTGLTPHGLVTADLIPRLLAHEKFAKLGIGQAELEGLRGAGGPVSYARFVTGIFDLYGKSRGKLLVGDKTPRYVRNIGTLHALWPEAKFVHLIRDGRDVCLSALNWKGKVANLAKLFSTWGEHPVTTTATWWKWSVRLGQEVGQTLGPGLYYEMRYEGLVAAPEEECARLCAFLGVDYEDGMLRFHEGRTRTKPGLDAKHAWLPITPGLRDWRTELPPEDQERFEAAAGDLLGELGYPRTVPQPRSSVLEHAAQIQRSFLEDVRAVALVNPTWERLA
jgi:hypothetical protein